MSKRHDYKKAFKLRMRMEKNKRYRNRNKRNEEEDNKEQMHGVNANTTNVNRLLEHNIESG